MTRREALEAINRRQNEANLFTNITEEDIDREIANAKKAGRMTPVKKAMFIPRVSNCVHCYEHYMITLLEAAQAVHEFWARGFITIDQADALIKYMAKMKRRS